MFTVERTIVSPKPDFGAYKLKVSMDDGTYVGTLRFPSEAAIEAFVGALQGVAAYQQSVTIKAGQDEPHGDYLT